MANLLTVSMEGISNEAVNYYAKGCKILKLSRFQEGLFYRSTLTRDKGKFMKNLYVWQVVFVSRDSKNVLGSCWLPFFAYVRDQ